MFDKVKPRVSVFITVKLVKCLKADYSECNRAAQLINNNSLLVIYNDAHFCSFDIISLSNTGMP